MIKLLLIFKNLAEINKKGAVVNNGGQPLIAFAGLFLKNPPSRKKI